LVALAERFVEARASGDLSALRDCLAADMVLQSNASPWLDDRERLISMTRERHERLANTRIEVVRLEPLSNGFLLEEVLHGSFDGSRVIAIPSCMVATCVDGVITSLAHYSDPDAGTSLLDDRARVWRLASTIARSGRRSHFTAVDVVRSAAALGLLTTSPLDPSSVDLKQFGSGVDEQAEQEVARHSEDDERTPIPYPAPALPAFDLMALAALMTGPAVARGAGSPSVLEDVIAALASNEPFMRQLAEASIDPRPLAEEWVARRDSLPTSKPSPTAFSQEDLERLKQLAGPPPPGWEEDRSSEGSEGPDEETEADKERRMAEERARWNELAARVAQGGDRGSAAAAEVREELRFEIAYWIRRHGTNGRTVDDAFEDAMQAVLDAAKSFDPDDRFGFWTKATAAYVGAVRGRPGGRARRTSA
jgi:hypothetical protein